MDYTPKTESNVAFMDPKRAWSSVEDVPPAEDEPSLADRILALGPLIATAKAAKEHPRLFDALLYVAFLALLTYVVIEAQDQPGVWPSSAPYESSRLLQRRYGDKFRTVDSIEKLFDYLEGDLLPIVYPLTWYNGDAIAKADIGFAGAGSNSPDNFRIMGAVQVRQIRTQKATCPTTYQRELRNIVLACVGEYSRYTQEEASFGPLEKGIPRYSFTTNKENGENSYEGQFSTYDGGGYVITLPADGAERTRNLALAKLQQMRADRWIDRQTRAVFVTINLFNPSTGYITAVRLILEHPAAGGLYPSVSTRHVPLGSLFADYAKLSTLGPEIALTIAVVFYMLWEFNQASMVSFVEYFSHFWGIYDWLNFSLFIVAYSFRWAAYDRAKLLTFPPANETFVNFETPAYHVAMWRNVLALNMLICYLKLFKYLKLIPSLEHLFRKIFFTMTDLLYLLLTFTFAFWGFSLSHFLAYGMSSSEICL